jgi:hypothetical protein
MPKKTMPKPKPSTEDAILGWIKAQRVDNMANYVRRGRIHAAIDDDTLRTEWVRTLKVRMANPDDEDLQRQHHDYEMELRVRGLDPPTEAVQEEIQIVANMLRAQQDEIRRDPEARRAAEEAFDAITRDYLEKRSKAN